MRKRTLLFLIGLLSTGPWSLAQDQATTTTLPPPSAMLYVQSNIAAHVLVDGISVGETNRVISNLPAGRQVTVTVNDPARAFEPAERKATLAANYITRLDVNPAARRVLLRVNSEPAGAEIYVDDEEYPGATPLDLSLTVGVHTIVLVKDGCQDVMYKNMDLRKDNPPDIRARLPPGKSSYDPFRHIYHEKNLPQAMALQMGADDGFTLYLNGTLVGQGQNWDVLYRYNVSLKEGDILAAKVTDASGGAAGMCGFRSRLVIGRFQKEIGQLFSWSATPYDDWMTKVTAKYLRPVHAVEHSINTKGPQMYWGEGAVGYIVWRYQ